MQNDSLFILIKGNDFEIENVEIKEEGLEVLSFKSNDKYLFLYLKVQKSGDYTIQIQNAKKKLKVPYSIKERNSDVRR